ncbi:MAG: hypothetical protein A4E28_01071 [Methanocella sp. PtaU1.Bin125]|nr:MAG: hypothetical protein A4E28_01071 [Methanocella sp. PtaU1.Bin125]
MSRSKQIKIGLSILIVGTLLMAVTSTALAEPPSWAQPNPASGNANKSDKDQDDQQGKNVSPGQLKLGNLKAPPLATLHNFTASPKANNTVVDTVHLNVAKKTASQRINLVIRQLETYKKQISRSRLSADEKAAAIAVADNNIAWYRQQESAIQAAADLETVNGLAAVTNDQIGQMKVNMKLEAGIMACEQMESRIAAANSVSVMAAEKIGELKASADVTAALEGQLARYNEHVAAASQYTYAARTAFEGITNEGNTDSGFNAGYQQLRQAEAEMLRAYTELKLFYQLYLHNARNN